VAKALDQCASEFWRPSVADDFGSEHRIGGFNPSEKYARQNGNLPQAGVNMKNV